ncbi:unnamed protein product, partial [Prunus brigantina]
MNEATRRRLEARAAQKKPRRPSQPKGKTPRPTESGSAQVSTPAERRREKRVAEAELVREAHRQITGKRVIEGTLDVTPLPKRPRGPNEDVAVLVPDDEEEAEAGPVNIACPRKVVPFVNAFIDAKIAEAGKMLQDADRHAAENAAKIAELSSKLAEAEKAAVDAEEARARAEAAKEDALRSRATEVEEAKKRAVEEYRSSEEFTALLDKEVMVQCEDLIY